MVPSPVPFDDVQVPDVTQDLTEAIRSTYGRHVTSARDNASQGHVKVTSDEQGHSRDVLEELSYRLQQGRKSHRNDAGHHGNNIRSSATYPLLVVNLYFIIAHILLTDTEPVAWRYIVGLAIIRSWVQFSPGQSCVATLGKFKKSPAG